MIIELRCSEDSDVFKQLQRRERDAKRRNRYRAVLLSLDGSKAPEIAAKLDRSRRFVKQWIYRHRDDGPTNLAEQFRSGIPAQHAGRTGCDELGIHHHVRQTSIPLVGVLAGNPTIITSHASPHGIVRWVIDPTSYPTLS